MDKYTMLFILNLPFILYGFFKSIAMYKRGTIQRFGLALRIVFWITILMGLLFAQNIYTFLVGHNLTDSAPLSLADVVLVTGVLFCFFLCTRLYSKLDDVERRLSDLHQEISIKISVK